MAGCRENFAEPDETLFTRAFSRFAAFDDAFFCKFCLDILPQLGNLSQHFSPVDEQRLQMLYFTFWDASLPPETYGTVIRQKLASLAKNPVLLSELEDLLTYRLNHLARGTIANTFPFPCPLRVHAHYTRNQICAAFDMLHPTTLRQGVYQIKEKQCDLLFVTLNKSAKDYSPSTMYQDYSLNDTLFHWQSQSTTSEDSPTAQRYFNHRDQGQHILLFTRESKEDALGKAPYIFLGEVDHVSHNGSCPVTIIWKLRHPIPADYINVTNKLVNE